MLGGCETEGINKNRSGCPFNQIRAIIQKSGKPASSKVRQASKFQKLLSQ